MTRPTRWQKEEACDEKKKVRISEVHDCIAGWGTDDSGLILCLVHLRALSLHFSKAVGLFWTSLEHVAISISLASVAAYSQKPCMDRSWQHFSWLIS